MKRKPEVRPRKHRVYFYSRPVPSVQEIIEQNMEEEELYAALDQLTEKQRKRVYAHYILGIKQSDIANMEGTSVSTVHESIKRGLRRLEKIMKKSL